MHKALETIIYNSFRYTLVIILWHVIPFCAVAQNNPYAHLQKIEHNSFENSRKFYYYNDSLIIDFNIKINASDNHFTEIFLKIESNNSEEILFITDWNQDYEKLSVASIFRDKIMRLTFPDSLNFHNEDINMSVILDFDRNTATVFANNQYVIFRNIGLNSQDGYRFNLFPSTENNELYISDVNIYTSSVRDSKKTWLWFLAIILLDIIIFIWIKYRRKNKKKKLLQKRREEAALMMSEDEKDFYFALPQKSAIYIIGNFVIKDKSGNEITKQFSPLLKELLTLIILYTSKNGITSEQLKEILWSKKSISSARNNRSVYFNKLRKIFEDIGNIELIDDNGHWKLQSTDVFIDYLEYQTLLAKDLETDEVLKMISIVKSGTILPDVNYDWVHNFQSEFSDSAIRNLLKVAQHSDFRDEKRMGIYLADLIFNLDRLNEHALFIKCKSYIAMGQHSSAKATFDKFKEEYLKVYGEEFPLDFSEFMERKDIVFDSNGVPFFE